MSLSPDYTPKGASQLFKYDIPISANIFKPLSSTKPIPKANITNIVNLHLDVASLKENLETFTTESSGNSHAEDAPISPFKESTSSNLLHHSSQSLTKENLVTSIRKNVEKLPLHDPEPSKASPKLAECSPPRNRIP